MKKIKTAFAVAAVLLAAAQPVSAQDMARVQDKERVKMDQHGTCRIIENLGNTNIMAPARIATEWSVGENAFTLNLADMNNVRLRTCNWPSTVGAAPSITAREGSTTYFTWNDGSLFPAPGRGILCGSLLRRFIIRIPASALLREA